MIAVYRISFKSKRGKEKESRFSGDRERKKDEKR